MRTVYQRIGMLAALASIALSAAAPAHAELVVIVSAKNPTAALTAEQIANVYLGKDASFSPLDLPESAALRGEFYSKVTRKDSAQLKAMWARLIFTGKAQPPKQIASSAEAVRQVAASERAMAYVDKSAVDASVRTVLKVE
jgi:DNA-binding transcriptional LysR family regulator